MTKPIHTINCRISSESLYIVQIHLLRGDDDDPNQKNLELRKEDIFEVDGDGDRTSARRS